MPGSARQAICHKMGGVSVARGPSACVVAGQDADPVAEGHERGGGVVGGSVVDDERFDGGDAFELLRQVAKRLRDRRLLIEGGDLND